LDEIELIRQLKEGREPAFRWLVDAYRDRVYGIVLQILQDPDEAEDAAQETFIQVHASVGDFKGSSRLSTWIYRIAVNKALVKIRRRKTRSRLQAVMPWWMPAENRSGGALWLNPGIRAENREMASALFKAISGLPEKQRLAFTLITVQGMSYEEACGILQLGVKAVESLVSRAKAGLRKKLEQDFKNT
jgi:RNA polymerase sigma-70 factor (ECF subfamily)